jgi:hypothetical protein
MTISLSKTQTKIVAAAAVHVPHEKRAQFFQRVSAMLTLRGRGHFDDADVADAVARALSGLIHAEA